METVKSMPDFDSWLEIEWVFMACFLISIFDFFIGDVIIFKKIKLVLFFYIKIY